MGEFELINAYFKRLVSPIATEYDLGIGDDCALVSVPPSKQLALSCDTLIEGVHFLQGSLPEDVGYRALAVNLSDLAAMGAEPAWFTLCLTLSDQEQRWVEGFCRGLSQLSSQFPLSLIGGDTTRGDRLSITIQVFGLVESGAALTRAGAREGDDIYVSGRIGEAGLGMLLSQTSAVSPPAAECAWAVTRFNRPLPRLELGQRISSIASSCIDVSDGLLADLNHILVASGVGAEVDISAVPLAQLLSEDNDGSIRHLPLAKQSVGQRRLWALAAGDDYELCFTAAKGQATTLATISGELGLPITHIGRIVAGTGMVEMNATKAPIQPRGYQHF